MAAVMKEAGVPTTAEFHQAISSRSDRWYSACLRITRSPELAEDAVQETYFRAWRSFDSFEGRSSLRVWLYRIATNAALDALRKEQDTQEIEQMRQTE